MEVFVKTLTGQTLTLEVATTDLVHTVKEQVARRTRVPPCQQRLSYAGRQLEDLRALSDYNVRADTTMHLALRLRGGMQAPNASEGGPSPWPRQL